VYTLLRVLVSFIVRLGIVRLSTRGAENCPTSGAVFLMSNHQSNVDPPLIAWSLPRPVSIPGKESLFAVPFLGWLLRQVGAFPVDRSVADVGSIRRSVAVLRAGGILAMFPEMTRSRSGEIGEFAPPLTKIAIRQRVPVLPVGIAGMGHFLPPGRCLPRLGAGMSIVIGEPIELSQFYGRSLSREDAALATAMIRERVTELHMQARELVGR
jgi:1-acyl-sn-glycerol-3-phosphate acyltransferase